MILIIILYMIRSYCKNRIPPEDIKFVESKILQFVTLDDGSVISTEVEDKQDTSIYGSFTDWSLDAMIKSGINPQSFTSPTVSGTRLEAAAAVDSIDLSSLNTPE